MIEDKSGVGQTEAKAMIEVFASVGAMRFDVTWTTSAGEKQRFELGVSVADIRRTMPALLNDAERKQHNLIVRPRGSGITFIQLDDLKAAQLVPVNPPVFLTLETSPGNYQAWVALGAIEDKDFARRLRKGTGADTTASGATRVAGSLNFKDKYAPNFPRVQIAAGQPGRRTTVEELLGLGLVAAPEIVQPAIAPARLRSGDKSRRWPSYERCIDGAPLNSEESGPDISRADFVFAMTARDWGFTERETVEQLMELSTKAQANGKRYAELTVRNASLAVERRKSQPTRGLG